MSIRMRSGRNFQRLLNRLVAGDRHPHDLVVEALQEATDVLRHQEFVFDNENAGFQNQFSACATKEISNVVPGLRVS